MKPYPQRANGYRRIYRMQGAVLAALITVGLLAAQAVVSDPVPPEPQFDVCRNALPRDPGEVVLNHLEPDGQGGYILKSEYHAVLGYGMANVPKAVD